MSEQDKQLSFKAPAAVVKRFRLLRIMLDVDSGVLLRRLLDCWDQVHGVRTGPETGGPAHVGRSPNQ